ncbi:hypothetical protein G7047_24060 [Diaphorobacter sp. HDW4A]|uniref:hypothetical protein n=1 Tax=Diaphorobacter sp. HDW4A TaxID=2714924 RepID=UPI001408581C|nr:hypothetical protein [Diaphorobacter sp. HDW4A]QIL82665.1 hypothetical protein G7047_24060 [Diaphorobacter sp. HDW4A]
MTNTAAQALHPLVLDVDGSVGPLDDETRLPLKDWQEGVRFGCTLNRYAAFRAEVEKRLPADWGTALMGSGDFHHLSWLLIEHRIALRGHTPANPLRVIVLDNHPDNMRFLWGVHCGSWVRRVAMHPAVSHVTVAGITSSDIGAGHAWENYKEPLRAGKLSYWSCGVNTDWAQRAGFGKAFRSFDNVSALSSELAQTLQAAPQPTYLSIDKDVFSPDVVRTNWDQGRMREEDAAQIIAALRGQIAGSDITGDISAWRYATWWKRLLSAGDGQDTQIPEMQLATSQIGQHALNERLVEQLARCHIAPIGSAQA